MSKSAHIIFIKYPEVGKVKTRLGRDIGMKMAAEIYKKMVENTLSACKSTKLLLFIEPYDRIEDFKEWLGDFDYFPQSDGDIGERMKSAFVKGFSLGYEKLILTGSDIPDLSSEVISDALISLNSADSVIGGAEDGGYYLIGFKQNSFNEKVFINISWSTSLVLSETLHIFRSIGQKTAMVKTLYDLDTSKELDRSGLLS